MDTTPLIPGRFTYAAWELGSRQVGPFVRGSRARETAVERALRVADSLAQASEVGQARVLVSTFNPPLPGHPRYDLALLARGDADLRDELSAQARNVGLPVPAFLTTARNVRRFGDTDSGNGNILLNHFAGPATPNDAITAWEKASQWYAGVLGVDNSTLLQFDSTEPFLIMNYVRLPASVPTFMAQQLLRPSFYREVLRPLRATCVRAFPIFWRTLDR